MWREKCCTVKQHVSGWTHSLLSCVERQQEEREGKGEREKGRKEHRGDGELTGLLLASEPIKMWMKGYGCGLETVHVIQSKGSVPPSALHFLFSSSETEVLENAVLYIFSCIFTQNMCVNNDG